MPPECCFIFNPHAWTYLSLTLAVWNAAFDRRLLFPSFVGVLTPSNLERARMRFGPYCLKSTLLSVFFAALKIACVRFSVIAVIHFEPALVPSVVLFSAAQRVFVFVGSLPLSTVGVVCLLSAHIDEPRCFRTPLIWLPSCPFPLALRAWWQHRCFPRSFSLRETRIISFLLTPFLHLGALVFRLRSSLRTSLS